MVVVDLVEVPGTAGMVEAATWPAKPDPDPETTINTDDRLTRVGEHNQFRQSTSRHQQQLRYYATSIVIDADIDTHTDADIDIDIGIDTPLVLQPPSTHTHRCQTKRRSRRSGSGCSRLATGSGELREGRHRGCGDGDGDVGEEGCEREGCRDMGHETGENVVTRAWVAVRFSLSPAVGVQLRTWTDICHKA